MIQTNNYLREVEGSFDGEVMWGDDNKVYPVPPNYASKSKLVEGDRLKLRIGMDGAFVFKQIGPVGRKRLVGKVTIEMKVLAEGKVYDILTPSMTYYKAEPGDDAVISIPIDGHPTWAALENIIENTDQDKELTNEYPR